MPILWIAIVSVLVGASACTKKDAEVVNQKGSTLDEFKFTPKPAAELAASAPESQTAAAASTSASQARSARKGSTLDTFGFKPKSAAELAAPQGTRK